MKAIGGYFELELSKGQEYHARALRLNTGRNALRYALEQGGWEGIHLPYYTCDAVLQAVQAAGVRSVFHEIGEGFELMLDPQKVGRNEAVLLTNYFGLKEVDPAHWTAAGIGLLVDNCQSFFCLATAGSTTFYSARKFFGVPDGAYLYTASAREGGLSLVEDDSSGRFAHLFMRLRRSAEDGYAEFRRQEALLATLPMMAMCPLTQALLASIDYRFVRERRRRNFEQLHAALGHLNRLPVEAWYGEGRVPMVYPLLMENCGVADRLREQRVYVARYWPNVLEWAPKASWDWHLARNLLALPIDQRYGSDEMKRVVDVIKHCI